MDFFGGVSTLVAGMLGVGVLTFPQSAMYSGFWASMIIFAGVAFLSHLGGVYLGFAGRLTNETALDKIGRAACGNLGVFMVFYAQILITMMASVAYFIFMWMMLKPVLGMVMPEAAANGLLDDSPTGEGARAFLLTIREWTIVIITAVLLIPCSMRKMSSLAWASNLAIVIFVVMIILMLIEYGSHFLMEKEGDGEWNWVDNMYFRWNPSAKGLSTEGQNAARNHPCYNNFDYAQNWFCTFDITGILITISLFNTGCLCHFSCASLFNKELKKSTYSTIHSVMMVALIITGSIYFLFTLAGWNYASKYQIFEPSSTKQSVKGQCQQGVQELAFHNMQQQDEVHLPPMAIGIMISVFFGLFLTFPLFIEACRGTIHSALFGNNSKEEASLALHLTESISIVCFIALCAILFPNALTVLAFAGALPGAGMVYIFPGMLMFSLTKGQPWYSKNRLMPLTLMIVGIFISSVATIVQIVDKNSERQSGDGENVFLKTDLNYGTMKMARGDDSIGLNWGKLNWRDNFKKERVPDQSTLENSYAFDASDLLDNDNKAKTQSTTSTEIKDRKPETMQSLWYFNYQIPKPSVSSPNVTDADKKKETLNVVIGRPITTSDKVSVWDGNALNCYALIGEKLKDYPNEIKDNEMYKIAEIEQWLEGQKEFLERKDILACATYLDFVEEKKKDEIKDPKTENKNKVALGYTKKFKYDPNPETKEPKLDYELKSKVIQDTLDALLGKKEPMKVKLTTLKDENEKKYHLVIQSQRNNRDGTTTDSLDITEQDFINIPYPTLTDQIKGSGLTEALPLTEYHSFRGSKRIVFRNWKEGAGEERTGKKDVKMEFKPETMFEEGKEGEVRGSLNALDKLLKRAEKVGEELKKKKMHVRDE